jgi:tetratricopeptide (TPR) repeat protein
VPPGGYAEEYNEAAATETHPNDGDAPASSTRGGDLEAALDEAEFYTVRGMFDDARGVLQEHLARHPNHPLLLERMAEISQQEQAHKQSSGTRERPHEEDLKTGVDRSFDIAASLDAVESLSDDQTGPAVGGFAQAHNQVNVEEVFSKFKEGVAAQISIDDGQSHYDLGVAYKEMGLIDDAIREFDTAARDPKRECICRSMIGMIQVERGSINEAIDAFLRGLAAKVRTPEQETVLAFELGSAYEIKHDTKQALAYYQKVARRDANYRDVQERIRRLTQPKPAPVRQVAVGADDEFDRAFDEMIGGGKP